MKVAITGSNGFIGKHVLKRLSDEQIEVIALTRTNGGCSVPYSEQRSIGDISPSTDWDSALRGANVVIHTAAIAHVAKRATPEFEHKLRQVNVSCIQNIVEAAARQNISRIIFLSSIKVLGEETPDGTRFTYSDSPNPQDAYSKSKLDAEELLEQKCREHSIEYVIIRPGLVHGPGVKGNFKKIERLVKLGIPLPFGKVANKRSFISIDSLVDLLLQCCMHPNAANEVFLAADSHDFSTSDLLKIAGSALNKPVTLLHVPVSILQFLTKLTGANSIRQKLLANLQISIEHTVTKLNWSPRSDAHQALQMTFKDNTDK